MNYEEIEVIGLGGVNKKHIVVYLDENNAKSFPADETNPEYVQFLEQQKTDLGK